VSQFWSPFPGDTELERSAKSSSTSASIGHEGRGETWDLGVSGTRHGHLVMQNVMQNGNSLVKGDLTKENDGCLWELPSVIKRGN